MLNPEKFKLTVETPESSPEQIEDQGVAEKVEKIRGEIINPRIVSKEEDGQGRKGVAEAVLSSRRKGRDIERNIINKEIEAQRIKERSRELWEEKIKKEEDLEKRIERTIVRIKEILRIEDKGVDAIKNEMELIQSELNSLISIRGKLSLVENEVKSLTEKREEMVNPKELLEAYYEKMSVMPLSNEEKRDLLEPEVLSNLSTEEYISLWKRLNPHFLSHTTRQGFRDHYGHIYHTAGMGEFHNGFVRMLEDEKLIKAPFSVRLMKEISYDSVRDRMIKPELFEKESSDQAKYSLEKNLTGLGGIIPYYPDVTAVHFGIQEVADKFYGGEENNETFIIFPSDLLASQYNFSFAGSISSFIKEDRTSMTDALVWPRSVSEGLPIDAGIVFLPKSIPVDPETGSKYFSEMIEENGEKKRILVEDQELIETLIDWGKKVPDNAHLSNMFYEYSHAGNLWDREESWKNLLNDFSEQLSNLGFSVETAVSVSEALIKSGNIFKKGSFNKSEALISLKSCNGQLKRAERTGRVTSSQEYWTEFFRKNPELKPQHIHFYDGNPTQAVLRFQQENNIGRADTSKEEGGFLGFDDNLVDVWNKDDQRAYPGYKELIGFANAIIDEHYKQKAD